MGADLKIVYAGISPPFSSTELDAAITFSDLDQIFRIRDVNVLSQPIFFERVPEERRRHLSCGGRAAALAAGGGPLLQPPVPEAPGAGRAEGGGPGGGGGPARPRLRGHPGDRGVAGSPAVGAAGGAVLAAGAAGQHRAAPEPVPGRGLGGGGERTGPRSRSRTGRCGPTRRRWRRSWTQIGLGPNGRPWDCRACGFDTCQRFAEAAALGRASLRQCAPYQERRAEEAPAGGGGRRADRALDLPGAAGPAGVRDRAEQAEQREVRGAVPRPGPVQAGERPVRARGRERYSPGRGRGDPATRSGPRTWRRATGATSSW